MFEKKKYLSKDLREKGEREELIFNIRTLYINTPAIVTAKRRSTAESAGLEI